MSLGKLALIVLFGAVLFGGGYEFGASRSPERQTENLARAEPQITDAIHRWALKAHESEASVRQHWSPRTMFIPTQNQGLGNLCVELRLEQGAVGGSPVYCYRGESTVLVAEYSDVE